MDHPVIFGTDGVRDRAGAGFLAPGAVARIASAAARVLSDPGAFPDDFPGAGSRTILLGRDTRPSGAEIAATAAETLARHGYTVLDLGVLTTPGVAFLSAAWPDVALGVVISASHNPADWNGIKFVGPRGAKISPAFEKAVSDAYWAGASPPGGVAAGGIADRSREAFEDYVGHLVKACRRPERLRGRKVALDLANGAAHRIAPEVFGRLGAAVLAMGDHPDGRNINEGCGALHPGALAELTRASGAALGFSFDGDGDRMIPVTALGKVLDGDHVLLLAGKHLRRAGRLPLGTVVATVMSNIGLEIALRAEGVSLLRTDVGDRHVYRAMVEGGHPLGGEQSGHVIFIEDARTGDGILAALRLADVLESDALDLDRESSAMRRYPQILRNLKVAEKRPFESLPGVLEAVKEAEARLGAEGRVNLRYSGTEPLARVMVEGRDAAVIEALAGSIIEAIERAGGALL
jgi:phosphoglucosamine mutase